MSLVKKFYSDRFFHIRQLLGSIAVTALACAALLKLRPYDFHRLDFSLWYLLLMPLGFWVGGMSVIFIHNATHDSFPGKWLNRFCGHLSGMHQLWGFTGWKLIHVFHHMYTDNADLDIHSPKGMTFGQYVRKMIYFPSQIISRKYYEHWGNTPKSHMIRKFSFLLFVILLLSNLTFWYLLLGPAGMIFFYIPSYVGAYFLFAHLNYYGHPVDANTGETHPVNLDHGLYFRLANRCWVGIYYHLNHHKKPALFNPMRMPESAAAKLAYS